MRPPPMMTKLWPEVRAAIDSGSGAYYVERDGFYDIVVPDDLIQCSLPTSETFAELTLDVKVFYNQRHVDEFESKYKPNLLTSKLSETAAAGR